MIFFLIYLLNIEVTIPLELCTVKKGLDVPAKSIKPYHPARMGHNFLLYREYIQCCRISKISNKVGRTDNLPAVASPNRVRNF